MSLGVEHGNEKFRAKYILRKMPNSLIVDRLNLLYDLKVAFSVNNIMGFPKDYKLKENYSQSYKQVGNSVCVPIIDKISENIVMLL